MRWISSDAAFQGMGRAAGLQGGTTVVGGSRRAGKRECAERSRNALCQRVGRIPGLTESRMKRHLLTTFLLRSSGPSYVEWKGENYSGRVFAVKLFSLYQPAGSNFSSSMIFVNDLRRE